MIKVLFVCHGNICRSVMAHYMMNEKIRRRHLQDLFEISSAATSTEELGNPIYYAAREKLNQKSIPIGDHRARQLERSDFDNYDMLIGMDGWNIQNMQRMSHGDQKSRIFKLMQFCGLQQDISDPWYTRDFETTYQQIDKALDGLIEYCLNEKQQF